MKVLLSNAGDIDLNQDPRHPLPGTIVQSVSVNDLCEASHVCTEYIAKHGLGYDNWLGGQITTEAGFEVARVSYDGCVWASGINHAKRLPVFQPMVRYHLLNDFGIYKTRIANGIPTNDDCPQHGMARAMLAIRTMKYTAWQLGILFGYLWTSHHDCVDANPDDFLPIQVRSAREQIRSGREAIDKLQAIKNGGGNAGA